MKISNKYLVFAGAALMLVSCDLDKLPEGDVVTGDQKEEIINKRPNLITAEVNAMAAKLNQFGTISTSSTYHSDYGVAAIAQMIDQSGQDMPVTTSGYNWFGRAQNYADRVYDSSDDELIWKTFYNHMKAANSVLTLTEGSDDASLKIYRGQAFAARAYDYLNLAQFYQFTYAGHENALCVPIVTEKKTDEELQNNPRATVQQVYDQIISDLNQALELMGESFDNGANKDQIDAAVVHGLRARAYLLMHKWKEAAADAEAAIAGGTPQSIKEVSTPTFNSASAASWLWGVIITEDNDVVKTGIINWPSHLCSLTGSGYTTLVGAWRFVSSKLYDMIPASDIRKQWFVSPEGTTSLVSPEVVGSFGMNPYTNVKFGAYQSIVGNPTNASDWPLMRVEEMYLIKAEAEAMGGDLAKAKTTLESFVQTYRDPQFKSKAASAEQFQDEVWLQRRMELWGEGFGLFDILRLKKPVDRKNSNYEAIIQYYIEPESQILIYRIPQCEMNTNAGISEEQNNPAAPQPTV